MFAEDALQLHPSHDSLEQWQGTDIIGTEFEAVGLGTFARECFPFGAASSGGGAIGEGLGFGHCGSPRGREEIGQRPTREPSGMWGRQAGRSFEEIILLNL